MSTVALRGTLWKTPDGGWQWKGMWAFGSSLATAPAQSQQPFAYTFQTARHPSEMAVPGEVEMKSDSVDDIEMSKEEASAVEPVKLPAAPLSNPEKAVQEESSDSKNPAKPEASAPETESASAADPNSTEKEAPDSSHVTPTKPSPEAERGTPKVTFATVPEGDPEFTEASKHHPDKPCPLSGHWKGYFQNLTGRPPRERVSKVQESFTIFLNATPGPHVHYTFDESPLPPTVHKDTLVHVRGMGDNPFGTFVIVGYLDLSSNVLEIQRQYVYVPVPQKKKSGSRGSRSGSTPMTTRHKKSHFTRKRQPSWKKRSLEEQEEQSQNRKARPSKRPKTGSENLTGSPILGVTTEPMVGSTHLPGVENAMATTSLTETDSGAVLPVAGAQLVPPTTPLSTTPLSITVPGQPVPKQRGTSGSGGASRKRSSGGGSKSSSQNNASSSANSTYLKLPPAGDPKKARWRAAHFLYYQRHDPEQQQAAQESQTTNGKSNSSSTTAAPNPRYVVYEGEMVNSQREGRGICLYSNGTLYEGEWKRNKEHGRGKLWTADRKRLVYDGEWERGRMQGQGTYYYSSSNSSGSTAGPRGGARYLGEFKENLRNGMGQYILPDGSVYSGMWSQGKMSGRGVFTWPDQSVYDGDWKDGQRHGQGLLKTADGFVYDGMWVHNAMEGRGSARYPNGQTYEGLFANGRREGRGTMKFTNGAVYEGRFRDDAVDGQGTMKMSQSLVVPKESGPSEEKTEEKPEEATSEATSKKLDFMIPISFQSDITHIHTKAGFTAIGD